jgi:hypothetical protein
MIAEYTFPVLMEIVKKGGRYMEEEIANLPSSSAKVCYCLLRVKRIRLWSSLQISLDETRAQWLTEGQPEHFAEFLNGRSLYQDEKVQRVHMMRVRITNSVCFCDYSCGSLIVLPMVATCAYKYSSL